MLDQARQAVRIGLATLAVAAAPIGAADLQIRVVDEHGAAVPDIAVYAEPLEHSNRLDARPDSGDVAVVRQIGSQFVPHILVVQAGASVRFPNNDDVSHHVYSFSKPKVFELDLYRGNIHPPEVFDHPGLVVLGCNIHDGMLGFILVVETPYFGKTDADGVVTLDGLPRGEFHVKVWTPRVSERHLPPAQDVLVAQSRQLELTFRFTSKLQPPHSTDPGSLEWKVY